MKVTITAYRSAIDDGNGHILGMADTPISSQVLTADGTATALPDETRYIRVGTDTAIHFKVEGAGAATSDPIMGAGAAEYFGAHEGLTPSVLTA